MLEYLVETYGYAMLFVGTALEGETILIIAGIAASEGLLDVHVAILAAFVGSMSGDTVYFLVGRYRGEWLVNRVPRWRPGVDRALRMLERHNHWLILTFRFIYGVRNVASIAVGMSRTPAWLFFVLNAVGAAVWAVIFGYGGYIFGETLIAVVKDVKGHQLQILGGACLVALVFWLFRIWRLRKRSVVAAKATSDMVDPGGSA